MEWAVTERASKSLSQTNTQPEFRREEMARRDGTEKRDKNSFYFPSFLSFICSQFLLDVEMHINFHIFPTLFRFIYFLSINTGFIASTLHGQKYMDFTQTTFYIGLNYEVTSRRQLAWLSINIVWLCLNRKKIIIK